MRHQLFIGVAAGRDASVIAGVAYADHKAVLPEAEVCFDPGVGEDGIGENVGHAIVSVAEGIEDFVAEVGLPGAGGKFQPGGGGIAEIELFDKLHDALIVVGVFLLARADPEVGDHVDACCFVFQFDADLAERELVIGMRKAGGGIAGCPREVIAVIQVGGSGEEEGGKGVRSGGGIGEGAGGGGEGRGVEGGRGVRAGWWNAEGIGEGAGERERVREPGTGDFLLEKGQQEKGFEHGVSLQVS